MCCLNFCVETVITDFHFWCIENSKEQHLFWNRHFCKNVKVSTVTFKIKNILLSPKLLNDSVHFTVFVNTAANFWAKSNSSKGTLMVAYAFVLWYHNLVLSSFTSQYLPSQKWHFSINTGMYCNLRKQEMWHHSLSLNKIIAKTYCWVITFINVTAHGTNHWIPHLSSHHISASHKCDFSHISLHHTHLKTWLTLNPLSSP